MTIADLRSVKLMSIAMMRCGSVAMRIFCGMLDHLPRKADDECMTELRWIYDRRTVEEARQDLAAWLKGVSVIRSCAIGWKATSRRLYVLPEYGIPEGAQERTIEKSRGMNACSKLTSRNVFPLRRSSSVCECQNSAWSTCPFQICRT